MIALDQARTRYVRLIEQTRPSLPGRDLSWLEQTRELATQRLADRGFPSRKHETWRYTSIDKLLALELAPALENITALQSEDLDEFEPTERAHRIVIANARFVPALSATDDLPDGVTVMGLAQALAQCPERLAPWLGQLAGEAAHAFNDINSAMLSDGVFIHVAEGVHLSTPIELIHVHIGRDAHFVAQPRTLMVVGSDASSTLVERYVSIGSPTYFHNGLTELALARGSRLDHYSIQEQSANAWHLSSQFLRQEHASDYRGTHLMLGGHWSRAELNVDFAGEHAQCRMKGLYLAGDKQLVDMHLNVKHNVPNCASEHTFRGILHGKGRGVFDGRILVAQDAQKTDAHLHNANLMLSRDAEVDTKPQLEIYADDVKCSHGTTVGELDAQQLYYLRSRGIPAQRASRILCQGFAAEVLADCEIDALGARLARALDQRLN